jgi:hypothetical protein
MVFRSFDGHVTLLVKDQKDWAPEQEKFHFCCVPLDNQMVSQMTIAEHDRWFLLEDGKLPRLYRLHYVTPEYNSRATKLLYYELSCSAIPMPDVKLFDALKLDFLKPCVAVKEKPKRVELILDEDF